MYRSAMLCALAALGLAAGCGAAPPIATEGDAVRARLALGDLQQGRTLLISKCGKCHRPPLPADQPISQWPREMDDMSGRAKIDLPQRQLIEQYLITMATH